MAETRGRRAAPFADDELEAAIAARRDLGPAMEPEIVDAFLDRVGAAIDARVDARLGSRAVAPVRRAGPSMQNFTLRIAVSLILGIPLTVLAGFITETSAFVGGLGVVGTWATIITLNAYYTEVEKDLEKERLRQR